MNCKNCGHELDLSKTYCANCGAKIIRNRLTIKSISADINQEFLNLDNKLLKTFAHLLTRPEAVINGYIDGTRKKYLNVIQYYAIALTLVGIQVFLMNTFFKEAMEMDPEMFMPIKDLEGQENNPFRDFGYSDFNNYQSVFYSLSVPLSAISTYLAYWVAGLRQFNFTEHLVMNLYYTAETIIINAILIITLLCFDVDFMRINYISSGIIIIYFFLVLKRVFKTSWILSIAMYLLVMAALGISFVVITLVGVLIGIAIIILGKKLGLI
ncbi:MAG: DUF3667 domain-containing protein [Psychroserpens sp.]|nr:DUF3667 domain-containing protein [Psychroserpens sp.]